MTRLRIESETILHMLEVSARQDLTAIQRLAVVQLDMTARLYYSEFSVSFDLM